MKIKPELKKNILKFGYGINHKYEGMLAHSFNRFYVYKYEGMLAHSFNRFYVVMIFILAIVSDIHFSKLKFEK